MIFEIVGAKVLAPYFGASHYVWISQILITLLSISFGTFLAGVIKPSKKTMGILMVSSGVYILVSIKALSSLVAVIIDLDYLLAASISSLFLFFYPLTILAMVYPVLGQPLIASGKGSLSTISAISTLGSVIGTGLTGLYLITHYSNYEILVYTSILIIAWAIAVAYFQSRNKKVLYALAIIPAVFFLLNNNSTSGDKMEVLDYHNSAFGEILLIKKDNKLMVINDGLTQNKYNEKKESLGLFSYMLSHLSLNYSTNSDRVLTLGVAMGVVPTYLTSLGKENIGVEINPEMIKFAEKYFDYDTKKIPTLIGDARYMIRKVEKKQDVIILDAFLVDTVPSNLITKQSFQEMKNLLNDKGILVVNSFGSTEPVSLITKSIFRTASTVFKYGKIWSINKYNVFYVFSDEPIEKRHDYPVPLAPELITEDWEKLKTAEITVSKDEGILMTDEYNPIEALDDSPRQFYRKQMKFLK